MPFPHPLKNFRARQPGNPLCRILWWQLWHTVFFVLFTLFYRFRFFGQRNIPKTGPILFICNHQSMLDPIIVGLGSSHRQPYSLARKTLWNSKRLGRFMDAVNGIPVDQENPDTASMKRCIQLLKQNHALLIFPEGARTLTGQTEPFEPGIMLIIKRAKPTIIPVAVEGAFDAWPRNKKYPKPFGHITCQYGQPIQAQTLLDMPPKPALEHLQQTVETLRIELADQMHES